MISKHHLFSCLAGFPCAWASSLWAEGSSGLCIFYLHTWLTWTESALLPRGLPGPSPDSSAAGFWLVLMVYTTVIWDLLIRSPRDPVKLKPLNSYKQQRLHQPKLSSPWELAALSVPQPFSYLSWRDLPPAEDRPEHLGLSKQPWCWAPGVSLAGLYLPADEIRCWAEGREQYLCIPALSASLESILGVA